MFSNNNRFVALRAGLLGASATLALAFGAPALAQSAGPGLGQQVRDIAQNQDRIDDQNGIGVVVRDLAQAEGDNDGDDEDDTDNDNNGIGGEVREFAQDREDRGGVADSVSGLRDARQSHGADVRDAARDPRGAGPN